MMLQGFDSWNRSDLVTAIASKHWQKRQFEWRDSLSGIFLKFDRNQHCFCLKWHYHLDGRQFSAQILDLYGSHRAHRAFCALRDYGATSRTGRKDVRVQQIQRVLQNKGSPTCPTTLRGPLLYSKRWNYGKQSLWRQQASTPWTAYKLVIRSINFLKSLEDNRVVRFNKLILDFAYNIERKYLNVKAIADWIWLHKWLQLTLKKACIHKHLNTSL